MRLIADVHISPRTVQFLNSCGHDVVAIHSILPADSPDRDIVRMAAVLDRVVLTQDLGSPAFWLRLAQRNRLSYRSGYHALLWTM